MKSLIVIGISGLLSFFLIAYGENQESICKVQHSPDVADIYCGIIPMPYVIFTLPIIIGGTIIATNLPDKNSQRSIS